MTLQNGLSRREVLIFLYKYRLRLALSFLIPFALITAISFIPVPRYVASGVLIVRMGSEFVYQPEVNSPGNPGSAISLGDQQIFKSEAAILGSDELHRQVIETIGLEKLFPELLHPQGFWQFTAYVRQNVNNTLETLGLAQPLPEEERERRLMARAVDLFDTRFDILLEKESAVLDLSFEHSDGKMATQTLDTLLKLYFDKRKQLYLQPRAARAKNDVDAMREEALKTGHAVEEFKRSHKIYALEEQRAGIIKRREELDHQAMSIRSPILTGKIAEYTQQLDQFDADERELNVLQKEADIAANAYSLYSSKLDEAKAYDNLQRERQDSVRIIQPPSIGAEPKRLQPLILLGGFFLSLILTFLAAIYTEFARRGFLAPEQIERSLGLPVLAVIPLRRGRH